MVEHHLDMVVVGGSIPLAPTRYEPGRPGSGAPFFLKQLDTMPVVTLPDGSQRQFDHPVTVDEVAASIGAGLRKAALAARVDDKLVDTSFLIDHDVKLAFGDAHGAWKFHDIVVIGFAGGRDACFSVSGSA